MQQEGSPVALHSARVSHDLVAAVVSAVRPAVTAAVNDAVRSSLQETWFSQLIQESVQKFLVSSSSSGGSCSSSSESLVGVQGSVLVETACAAAAKLDSLCLWHVPCPVCGEKTFANEKVFDEHLKLIIKNISGRQRKKSKCVLLCDNDFHVRLLERWNNGQNWDGQVVDFVDSLRSLLNPGSKKVYRPGGTGNDIKVKAFIQSCLSTVPAQLSAQSCFAPGALHDVWPTDNFDDL